MFSQPCPVNALDKYNIAAEENNNGHKYLHHRS